MASEPPEGPKIGEGPTANLAIDANSPLGCTYTLKYAPQSIHSLAKPSNSFPYWKPSKYLRKGIPLLIRMTKTALDSLNRMRARDPPVLGQRRWEHRSMYIRHARPLHEIHMHSLVPLYSVSLLSFLLVHSNLIIKNDSVGLSIDLSHLFLCLQTSCAWHTVAI
jgi:hypothetical protein